ncbi:unnamed protein product [Lampetra planeri]
MDGVSSDGLHRNSSDEIGKKASRFICGERSACVAMRADGRVWQRSGSNKRGARGGDVTLTETEPRGELTCARGAPRSAASLDR